MLNDRRPIYITVKKLYVVGIAKLKAIFSETIYNIILYYIL